MSNVILFIAGLGTFLIGCKLLSDNIEVLANRGLKKLFNKSSKSKIVGVGIGAATTAVVQSSSATTVLVVGFVNAGVMSLFQAATVIMGANIGTTITAQIVALKSFDVSMYAMALAAIGIFINMLGKTDKVKVLGIALAGLGLIFIGLESMSNAMEYLKSESTIIQDTLSKVSNPLVLVILGAIITAIVQSSSAVTSIVITMVGTGLVIGNGGNSVLYVVLGTNIGTCITALLSSMGATANAKRASFIHFLFNFLGSIIFTIILLLWPSFMDDVLCRMFKHSTTQIAMFHTFFNVICTIIFLPLTSVLVKISEKVIKDKKDIKKQLIKMDERMLQYPSVALGQLTKEISVMSFEAMNVLNMSIEDFLSKQEENKEKIKKINGKLELMGKEIISYLVTISSLNISLNEEKMISAFHHNLNDILRIGELADNITKYTSSVVKDGLEFSSKVIEEIGKMQNLINELYRLTNMTFNSRKLDLIDEINSIEDQIDNMRATLIADHLDRLKAGKCQPQSSGVFINLVNNLERAADHITFIAESV
ncbi:MAG: Na/Pi cotransporter family protein [Bacilli bacterium]|nr:Na/Pi cotransporter family protein [Bacilli bacterium]